ncbi:MAG: hypothetical protein SFY80_02625 [Verrucomicrobiota bacterium]|nr:hypothetical protein [Verrucomicrobiota bacterium]
MSAYLYLSLIPEALVASMLPPEEFGNYLAVGSRKRTRGQALFFEVDAALLPKNYFPLDEISKRCVPHEDGTPRRSVYLSIYRALEHVPLAALKKLYLVTEDGKVLGLDAQSYETEPADELHLYQEFCPVHPRVVSKLNPTAFVKFITDQSQPVSVPRIVFCELVLRDLRTDPDNANVDDLPYTNLNHLRDCLKELKHKYSTPTKTVIRQMTHEVLFRTIRGGFFVGDQTGLKYYPLPSRDVLETTCYHWWRSALIAYGG